MTEVAMIWAQARGGVIGDGGAMLWHVPEDLVRFKRLTLGNPVIMGRKTWDSLPPRFRPLEGRLNVVITRQRGWSADGAETAGSTEGALEIAEGAGTGIVWITGGGAVYDEFLSRAQRLEVTEVDGVYDGETLAPVIGDEWRLIATDPAEGWHTSRTGIGYRFLTYSRTDTR